MQQVVLGLGSNKAFHGKVPLENLIGACHELSAILSNPVFSSVYRTKAMYVEDQDDFHNMVVTGSVSDELTPFELLTKIQKIEKKYGRNRKKEIRFGPRSLDIDIEEFGNVEMNTEILQIPHIRIKERAFVLIPLLEIFPKDADEVKKSLYLSCLKTLEEKNGTSDVEKIVSKEIFTDLVNSYRQVGIWKKKKEMLKLL